MLELADIRYVGSGRARLGGDDGQALHEGGVRRRRAAGRPVRRDHRPAVAARPGRGHGRRGRARLAGVRQAGPGRVEHGHHQGHRPEELRGGDRGGPGARPQGRRRGRRSSAARSSARCCRAATAAAPRRASSGRRSSSSRATSSTTSRPSTSPRTTSLLSLPGRPARRRSPPRCAELAAAAFEARGLRGAGPGRLLLHRDRRRDRQRDQHDAGVHPALDVPADVGGQRPGLPRADRRAASSWP